MSTRPYITTKEMELSTMSGDTITVPKGTRCTLETWVSGSVYVSISVIRNSGRVYSTTRRVPF